MIGMCRLKRARTDSTTDDEVIPYDEREDTDTSASSTDDVASAPLRSTTREKVTKMRSFFDGCKRWIAVAYKPEETYEGTENFRAVVCGLNAASLFLDLDGVSHAIADVVRRVRWRINKAVEGGHVALSIDRWSSCPQHSYLAVTAHVIDENWKLQRYLLGCCQYKGGNLVDDTAARLCKTLWEGYGITNDKIVAVISDSSVNMDVFRPLLACPHIYCMNHVLQLSCCSEEDGLPVVVKQVFAKATKIESEILSSPQKRRQFSRLQLRQHANLRPLNLIEDVGSSRRSKLTMFRSLLSQQHIISLAVPGAIVSENLTAGEWNLLEELVTYYRSFETAQRQLEGDRYVTSSLVLPRVHFLLKKVEEQILSTDQEDAKIMLKIMRQDFIKRLNALAAGSIWNQTHLRDEFNMPVGVPNNFLVAAALDPRTKHLSWLDKADRTEVQCKLLALVSSVVYVAPTVPVSNQPYDEDNIMFGPCLEERNRPRGPPINPFQVAYNEIALFYRLQHLPPKTGDAWNCPLQRWKRHRVLFPHLAGLAVRYLCVPATVASSERFFMSAELTPANARADVTPQLASDLIILKAAVDDFPNFGDLWNVYR
jgi:hypothetical protein